MRRAIRLERFYPHPQEQVFAAITDPVLLSEWLMPNDFVAKLGHEFTFRSKPQGNWNGITHCKVLELEPPKRLSYSWSGDRADGQGKALANTVVTWSLSRERGGTKLVLTHTGFEGFGEVAVSFMLQLGWRKMLIEKLPRMIARSAA